MEFADEFPGAVVIGTDLSPIQPDFVPPNLKFYVDDFQRSVGVSGGWKIRFHTLAFAVWEYRKLVQGISPGIP